MILFTKCNKLSRMDFKSHMTPISRYGYKVESKYCWTQSAITDSHESIFKIEETVLAKHISFQTTGGSK